MPRPSDERLIAYLDGELDESQHDAVALELERDPQLRDLAGRLSESAALLRAACDETLHEPVPERLIAAARGETKTVDLAAVRKKRWTARFGDRRFWIGVPIAASLFGLLVGTSLGYFAHPEQPVDSNGSNIANIFTYYDISLKYGASDVPGSDPDVQKAMQKLPSDLRLPNLKPWGLAFQGARVISIEGHQATQLYYTTDNKALGPLTVVVGTSTKPDLAPTFSSRDNVNLLYWRHHGHSYALVGTADIGYLWNIHNDIAYQLDTI